MVIYSREDFDNDEQYKRYLEIRDSFRRENEASLRIGSYCLSGQEYFAYHSARERGMKLRPASLSDLVVS